MCLCISPDLDGHVALKMEQRRVLVRFLARGVKASTLNPKPQTHVALKMEQRRVLVRFLARGVKVSLYTNVGEYCPCFITHPRVNPN